VRRIASLRGFIFDTTLRNKVAAVLFYLSVEAFLFPVAVVGMMITRTGPRWSGFQQLSVTVFAAVIGFAVAIPFLLISRRVEVESVETVPE